MLRDSSDLHIYKDLYMENNDCFCKLWKCSDLNNNRLVFFPPVWSLSRFTAILLVLEEPVCSLYIAGCGTFLMLMEGREMKLYSELLILLVDYISSWRRKDA